MASEREFNKTIRGVTLLEILIAAGIFSLVLSGAFGLYRSGSRFFVTGTWRQEEQKRTQIFLEELAKELSQATPGLFRITESGTTINDFPTPIYVNSLVYSTDGIPKAPLMNLPNWTCLLAFSIARPFVEANATFSTPLTPGKWSGVSLWARQRTLRVVRSGDPNIFSTSPANLPNALPGIPGPTVVGPGLNFQSDSEHARQRDLSNCLDRFSVIASSTPPTNLQILARFVRMVNNQPTDVFFEQSIAVNLASNSMVTSF